MDEKKHKKKKTKPTPTPKTNSEDPEEQNNYGGLPDDIDLRKNLGCG